MMSVLEYAQDVNKTINEILNRAYKYVRPVISEDDVLEIKQGRHPVIERQLPVGESYVPNDLYNKKDS